MPTGYTEKLYDGHNQTFSEFVLRCARAFGALISMRDDSLEKTIPDEFVPYKWYQEQRVQAEERLNRARNWTSEEAELAAAQYHAQNVAGIKKSNAVNYARWERYHSMLTEVKRWTPPSPEYVELKEFMIKQLDDSMKYDCYTMEIPVCMSGESYRQREIMQAEKDIAYHIKENDLEVNRAQEKTNWVRVLKRNLAMLEMEKTTTVRTYVDEMCPGRD